MIPDIKKILFATDVSKNSFHSFRYALKIAMKFEAKVTILHVLEEAPEDAQLAFLAYIDKEKRRELLDDRIDHTRKRIKERLEAFCKKIFRDSPECAETVESIQIMEGYPADEILKAAKRLHCDAVIMGAHRKGVTSYTYLGSVTQRVLQRARMPVFVIPLPEGDEEDIFRDFADLF